MPYTVTFFQDVGGMYSVIESRHRTDTLICSDVPLSDAGYGESR